MSNNEVVDGRPVPKTCFVCKGAKIRPHCKTSPHCAWVRCRDCHAVSGYKHSKDGHGVFAGWKRISYNIGAAA